MVAGLMGVSLFVLRLYFNYIDGDEHDLGAQPLERMAEEDNLAAYFIKDSGSPWIPCVTRSIWKNFGLPTGAMEGMAMSAEFWKDKKVLF